MACCANDSVLIFGAQDTTSSALSRILYMLSVHTNWQDNLREEILEALDTSGRDGRLSYEDVVKLPLLDAVLKETLRLWVCVEWSIYLVKSFSFMTGSRPFLSFAARTCYSSEDTDPLLTLHMYPELPRRGQFHSLRKQGIRLLSPFPLAQRSLWVSLVRIGWSPFGGCVYLSPPVRVSATQQCTPYTDGHGSIRAYLGRRERMESRAVDGIEGSRAGALVECEASGYIRWNVSSCYLPCFSCLVSAGGSRY